MTDPELAEAFGAATKASSPVYRASMRDTWRLEELDDDGHTVHEALAEARERALAYLQAYLEAEE